MDKRTILITLAAVPRVCMEHGSVAGVDFDVLHGPA